MERLLSSDLFNLIFPGVLMLVIPIAVTVLKLAYRRFEKTVETVEKIKEPRYMTPELFNEVKAVDSIPLNADCIQAGTISASKIASGYLAYNDATAITGTIAYPWEQKRPTNCKNCGAPLHGRRCEYCGTEY